MNAPCSHEPCSRSVYSNLLPESLLGLALLQFGSPCLQEPWMCTLPHHTYMRECSLVSHPRCASSLRLRSARCGCDVQPNLCHRKIERSEPQRSLEATLQHFLAGAPEEHQHYTGTIHQGSASCASAILRHVMDAQAVPGSTEQSGATTSDPRRTHEVVNRATLTPALR